MMAASLLLVLLGLVLLYGGAECLVRGSSSLAFRLKISPLVIGLTVVAYGTSMPELVVSIRAALSDQGSIAIGNVIGSNIFNIAVILGIAALIRPLKVNIKLIRKDTPIMIFTALLFAVLFRDFKVSLIEGLILLLCALIYTFTNFYMAKRAPQKDLHKIKEEIPESRYFKNIYLEILIIIIGLLTLIFGAKFLVDGSVKFARIIGVSEAVIGLTIIAAGTSLPELATSVVASFQGKSDIAIGNVIGSNIFNILLILGISAMLSPINSSGINSTDVYLLITLSCLLLPLMWSKFEIQRWEGLVLIGIYAGYIYYLAKF